MTQAEQKELIRDLLEYVRKMNRYEEEEFQMFVKRNKDDEDLDRISQRRLQEFHEKYVPQRRPRS